MKKSLLSMSLVTVLMAAGCSDKPAVSPAPMNNPTPNTTTPTVVTQTEGETIYMAKQDLDGDGKAETVSLLGFDKQDSNQLAVKKIKVRIEGDGWNQEAESVYDSHVKPIDLAIVDLTADGRKEIALKMDRGGTGKGNVELTLFTLLQDKKLEEMKIDNNRAPEFKLRLVNGNKYELTDPLTGRYWILQTDEEHTAATGNPNMSGQKPQADPAHEWNWTDADNDGKMELVSKQAVWMAAHANILFDVQTTYKWDGTTWKPQGYTILPSQGVKIVN